MFQEEEERRYLPLKDAGRYKRVSVSDEHRRLIGDVVGKCPDDWGPAQLAAAVKRYHRVVVTPDQVWTVLSS